MCSDFPESYFDNSVRSCARIFLGYNWQQKNYCWDNDVIFFAFSFTHTLNCRTILSRGSVEGTENQGERPSEYSLQCRRILGRRKLLVYVHTVVTTIFVMTGEDQGK